MPFIFLCLFAAATLGAAAMEPGRRDDGPASPPDLVTAMTPERMAGIVQRIDPESQQSGNSIEFVVDDHTVLIVYDVAADRMRIMVPVTRVDQLEEGQLERMLQANFDSALDARYAIAREVVWSVFIHPLSKLDDEEFVLGVGQTVNVAATFGDGYSSGALVYGGGDSGAIERRRLIDKLKEMTET